MKEQSTSISEFLRPEVVSKLANMNLRARLIVEGFIAGLHRSPYHGFSVEFAEYRAYNAGESVKNVDWRLYGRTYPDSEVEFINFKIRASLPERLLQLPRIERKDGQSIDDAIKGTRLAYSNLAKDFIPYTVYDRYKLFPDANFKGPAIIEERESTLVVGEDGYVKMDDFGFLWIDLKEVQ